MRKIRTFVDSGVLIAATRGDKPLKQVFALTLLADFTRDFYTSSLVYLETPPYAVREHRREEEDTLRDYFELASMAHVSPEAVDSAFNLISRLSLKTMDALHIAVAVELGCDEFVTTEKKGRSMLYRVSSLRVLELSADGLLSAH